MTKGTSTTAQIEALPLFHALSTSRRAALLRSVLLQGLPAGTILFEQGETPNFQHIVLSGSVFLFGHSGAEREVLIETVTAPDLVVPAAAATGSPYLLRAKLREPSRIALIPAAAFREAVAAEPSLAIEVISSLDRQFRRMVRQVKNLKLRSANERVGCYLLGLARQQGTPHRAVLPYEKRLIASELGITRESFSRALAALQADGIAVQGEVVEIKNPRRLAALCAPDPLIDGGEEELDTVPVAV